MNTLLNTNVVLYPERPGYAAPNDRPAEPDCDRCNEPLDPDGWIRVSTRPASSLEDRYETTNRRWCPDCVAAVGLLAIDAERPRASAETD